MFPSTASTWWQDRLRYSPYCSKMSRHVPPYSVTMQILEHWRHTEEQKSPETDLSQEHSGMRNRPPSYPVRSYLRRQQVRTYNIRDHRRKISERYFNGDNSFTCKNTQAVVKHMRSFEMWRTPCSQLPVRLMCHGLRSTSQLPAVKPHLAHNPFHHVRLWTRNDLVGRGTSLAQ